MQVRGVRLGGDAGSWGAGLKGDGSGFGMIRAGRAFHRMGAAMLKMKVVSLSSLCHGVQAFRGISGVGLIRGVKASTEWKAPIVKMKGGRLSRWLTGSRVSGVCCALV